MDSRYTLTRGQYKKLKKQVRQYEEAFNDAKKLHKKLKKKYRKKWKALKVSLAPLSKKMSAVGKELESAEGKFKKARKRLRKSELVPVKAKAKMKNKNKGKSKNKNKNKKDPIEPSQQAGSSQIQQKSNLKLLSGIGPKIESLLQAAGLHSFADLAAAEEAQLRTILREAGSRYQMHNPGSWPEQAALASKAAWEDLKHLQQQLKNQKNA